MLTDQEIRRLKKQSKDDLEFGRAVIDAVLKKTLVATAGKTILHFREELVAYLDGNNALLEKRRDKK